MTFKIKLEPKTEKPTEKVVTDEYELWLGDCLELMKDIPDKSIDMILCDLPYGTQNRSANKPKQITLW